MKTSLYTIIIFTMNLTLQKRISLCSKALQIHNIINHIKKPWAWSRGTQVCSMRSFGFDHQHCYSVKENLHGREASYVENIFQCIHLYNILQIPVAIVIVKVQNILCLVILDIFWGNVQLSFSQALPNLISKAQTKFRKHHELL